MLLTKKSSSVGGGHRTSFVQGLQRGLASALPTMDRRAFLRRSGLGVGVGLAATQLTLVKKAKAASGGSIDGTITLGQLRHWYSETYGANDYHLTWVGFNFPSKVLIPFKEGLFDPLTPEENKLLELFRYRKDNFYIIGAQNNATLRHELAHALYSSNEKYRTDIDNFLKKHTTKLKKLRNILLKKGYCKEVLNDEIQAYITDNDDPQIINSTCPSIITGINTIYNSYNKIKANK